MTHAFVLAAAFALPVVFGTYAAFANPGLTHGRPSIQLAPADVMSSLDTSSPGSAAAFELHDSVPDPADALFTHSFDGGLLGGGVQNIRIDLSNGFYLPARLYGPAQPKGAVVVMMHGCSGLWSQGEPWTVAQGAIEKWGVELARNGYFALAIDSYTSRTPAGIDPHDFQQQCAGDIHEGAVDPYTMRVDDMNTGIAWLRYHLGSAAWRLGALGWSQGAQSVLVRSAETYAYENVSRFDQPADAANAQLVSVAFYPGCGTNLGFVEGSEVAGSYWRPHRDLRMNHGGADPLHASCADRSQIAIGTYDSIADSGHAVDYVEYPDAQHSFDSAITEWPAARCAPEAAPSDFCAASDADIGSLEYLMARLVPPGDP